MECAATILLTLLTAILSAAVAAELAQETHCVNQMVREFMQLKRAFISDGDVPCRTTSTPYLIACDSGRTIRLYLGAL